MTDDWHLDFDDKGEVYTGFEASRESIEGHLQGFDGRTRFSCTIGRRSTENYLCCIGQPDKQFIEGMRDGSFIVVRKADPASGAPVPVRCGDGPTETFLVDPSEALTAAESLALMLFYRETEELPTGYIAVPKSYRAGWFPQEP